MQPIWVAYPILCDSHVHGSRIMSYPAHRKVCGARAGRLLPATRAACRIARTTGRQRVSYARPYEYLAGGGHMSMGPSGSHLAALGLGLGIGAGAQLLACCASQPPPQQQLTDGGEPALRRRVKLSAADPANTPIRDDVVAAALAALGPAVAEPSSVRLEPRRSFATATFTASSEKGMVALNQALVATMMGQGLDVSDTWSAGDGGRGSTKRWHVTLADDHQGSSVYFDERAARAHNFATLFAKGAGRMVRRPPVSRTYICLAAPYHSTCDVWADGACACACACATGRFAPRDAVWRRRPPQCRASHAAVDLLRRRHAASPFL